ncbi:MAG TPA: hypothetical protein ENJ22_00960 [Gammaproteobacteria bacterium]|nr:hypothetical protein [Gammaproteobacteria bacterium]
MNPAVFRPSMALLLLMMITGSAFCGEALRSPLAPDITLLVGAENFRWQEFDDNGQRLLTEQGPRYLAGLALGNTAGRDAGAIYELLARGYAGKVDYDGQDSNAVFTSSDTSYRGWQAEFMAGYRFPSPASMLSMEIHLAAGGEGWRRDIDNSTNSLGNPVSGFVEEYSVYYGRLGVGFLWPHRWAQSRVVAGGRRPFRVDEDVDAFNITLAPREQWSGYAAYELYFPTGQGSSILRLRYDSFRFDTSKPKVIGGTSVWQPESDLDLWGISLGYVF